MKSKIGPVTAYADAVQAGYTGTREEFARQQAEFAKNAAKVEQAKTEVNQAIESFGQTANVAKQDVISEGDKQIKRINDAAPDLEMDREQIRKNTEDIKSKITNPPNGTTGQVLTKTENGEEWKAPTGGNAPMKLADLESDINHRTVTDTEKESWNGKYNKPASGIPSSDLADGVVSDVQIDGTSIVGEDGVAKIPIATNKTKGIASASATFGISVVNGDLCIVPSILSDISSRKGRYSALNSVNYDYAVKCAMTDGKGAAWTDAEKSGAWERLSSIKTAMDEVAVAGSHYYLGELSELAITLPDDALVGQEITISWYNGDTPATLSITGDMLDFDFTPAANTRSEISCLWDNTYWSVIGMSQEVPMEEVVADE